MRLIGTVVLSAVVTFGSSVYADSENSPFSDMNSHTLCNHYMDTREDDAFQELKTRGYLNRYGLKAVREDQVVPGMSRMGLSCLRGHPDGSNTTRTASGTRVQLIYGSGRNREFVYTENGIVTSHQY